MKSLEEFVELFAEQFDETDASEITADKNFRVSGVVISYRSLNHRYGRRRI